MGKITSAGPTKKFEFNGKEVATVDFDSSSKKASHTMHLPSGKDLTIDLAWPKMTPAASDLEFGVTITPDRKVVTKFGWEMAGVKKVYLDVVGNNPWIGDYKLSRQGEFEPVSPSVYKIKYRSWRDHQWLPSQDLTSGDQRGHQLQHEQHEGGRHCLEVLCRQEVRLHPHQRQVLAPGW